MKTKFVVGLSLLAGVALGAGGIEGLHAKGKSKAYTVGELETIDAAAAKAFAAKAQAAQKKAGGHPFRTGGGKVVALEGDAPKRVAITEWNSLEQAEAFYKSKAWTDLGPERDKAIKTVRRYIVEVAQ
jgi:uncharacterized protein (DUF1330 family)